MNFFKTFLASLLALVVGGMALFIFSVMIFAGIVATLGNRSVATVPAGSVLVIDLSNGIVDQPDPSPFKNIGLGGITLNNSNSIFEALSAIENAELDKNIRGIYINVTGGSVSMANIEELRRAIDRFRERSAKFVVAYADTYSQAGYYLSSVADKVFLHPQGAVAWHGLSSQVMFYKGLLDKLGVRVEILRHGSFKSAVEPFMLDRMSMESKTQMNTVLGSVWDMMLADVSLSRGIDADALSYYADELAVRIGPTAVELGLVDALLYEDQVVELMGRLAEKGGLSIENELKNIMQPEAQQDEPSGTEPNETERSAEETDALRSEVRDIVGENIRDDISDAPLTKPVLRKSAKYKNDGRLSPGLIRLSDYIASLGSGYLSSGQRADKIALVYVDGDIIDGMSVSGSAGGATVAQKLSAVRRDDRVKGVVVRVNSPGGSALASDVIWREMEMLRREKPVVVSMGAYAASGGYYVSAPADIIVANRSTLTGSIGVFGLMVNLEGTMRDKLGITVDVAKTNQYADMGSIFRPVKQTEKERMMQSIEQIYETFVGHVAAGRNMTAEQVDIIGGGRVWSGANAVEIGLADQTGGLVDAIFLCAQSAGIADKEYRITEVVEAPDAISTFVRMFSSSESAAIRDEMGEAFVHYNALMKMIGQPGPQARMPFVIEFR